MSQKIKYLYDNKEIEDILAEGFAKICQQKPKFPINYLARFLKNHTIKNSEKQNLVDKLEANHRVINKMADHEQKVKQQMLVKLEKQKVYKMQKDNFLMKISSAERHQQVLDYFCEWITDRLKITGVYVGQLENQVKKINNLQEDGEQAHLQLDKQKVIKFKYASEGQKKIVVGKILTQQSIIGKILSEAQAQGTPNQQQGGQNQQGSKPAQIKGEIYIPSVVGNQQLKFFRFPKLGSYFASVLTIKSYLKQKLFDQNTVKIENYRKVIHDFEKQMQEKQTKFKEMYDQKVNAGTEQKQLQDLQRQFQRQKGEIKRPVIQQLGYYQRKFVVCADTLGLDREITQKQKQQIRQLILYLKQSWQSQQKKQLQNDIELQLSVFKPHSQQGHEVQIPNFPEQYTTLLEQQQKQVASHEQVQKVKDNQKLLELQSNTVRLQKTKQYLSEEKYIHFWDHLLQLNVTKYNQIIKQFLILLGFRKDQFCFKGTNSFDWQKTKNLLKDNRLKIFQLISAINPRGSRPELVQPYAKCARIEKNLQGLQGLAIAGYNLYLSFLLRLLQLYTKIRVQDKEARKTKIEAQRQSRQAKIKEAEQKTVQKKQKLDQLKVELQQKGQLEAFDEQSWSAQYDQENPLLQIPDEIPNDIDRDLQDVPVQEQKGGQ